MRFLLKGMNTREFKELSRGWPVKMNKKNVKEFTNIDKLITPKTSSQIVDLSEDMDLTQTVAVSDKWESSSEESRDVPSNLDLVNTVNLWMENQGRFHIEKWLADNAFEDEKKEKDKAEIIASSFNPSFNKRYQGHCPMKEPKSLVDNFLGSNNMNVERSFSYNERPSSVTKSGEKRKKPVLKKSKLT